MIVEINIHFFNKISRKRTKTIIMLIIILKVEKTVLFLKLCCFYSTTNSLCNYCLFCSKPHLTLMQCGSEYLQLAQIRRPQHSHTQGIAFVSSTGRMSNWHPRHCFGVALSAASYSMHSASFFFSSSSHAVSLASSLCSSADEEKGDVVFDITYITLLVGSIIKTLHSGRESGDLSLFLSLARALARSGFYGQPHR